MFDKNIILVVIFVLLIIFYLVIRLGAGKKKELEESYKESRRQTKERNDKKE